MTFATGNVQSSAAMADPARLTRADVAAAMMLTLTRNLAMAVPSLFSNHLFIARRERNLLAGRFEFSAPGRPQVRVTSPYGQCRRIVAGLWNAKPTVGLLRQCRAHANYRQREALTTRSARLFFCIDISRKTVNPVAAVVLERKLSTLLR